MKKYLAFLLLPAPLVLASNTYTYVASTGSDASATCSYAAPCRTFAGATTKTSPGGTILALDGGDFGLGATLSLDGTGAIKIDGGSSGAFMTGPNGGSAVVMNSTLGQGIVVRNLVIYTGGGPHSYGINGTLGGQSGQQALIEDVTVVGYDQTLTTCISLSGPAGTSAALKRVNVTNGFVGISASTSGAGQFKLTLDEVDAGLGGTALSLTNVTASVRRSVLHDSINYGVACQTAGNLTLKDVQITGNVFGIVTAGAGCIVKLSDLLIADNGTGVVNNGGTVISFRNNVFDGNGSDGAPLLSTSFK